MRTTLRWLLVVMIGLIAGQEIAPADSARRPRAMALVAFPSCEGFPSLAMGSPPDSVIIVAGYSAGRGWIGGEKMKGVLHRGDKLPVYALEAGLIGSAQLTDDGYLSSTGFQSPYPYGLVYAATVQLAQDRAGAGRGEFLTCVWQTPGTRAPRRVWARQANAKSRTYRKPIATWLRGRGLIGKAIERMRIGQVLLADVNHDGRIDALLSVDWYDDLTLDKDPGPYLLLHYTPRGAAESRMVEVAHTPAGWLQVAGLYDLDRNGWAELVVAHFNGEQWGTRLYYRTAHGYAFLQGDLYSL